MRNISIRDYLQSKEYAKYGTLLSSLNPKDHLNFDLNKLSYNDVIQCNRVLVKAKGIEDVKKLFVTAYKLQDYEFYSIPIVNFFQSKKFLIDKFVYLRENESKLLSSSDEDAMYFDAAGGKRLNEFSDVLPLDKMAKIYGGYPVDYGNKKYVEIVFLLRMNKVSNQVDKRFNELKYNK
jgi:hypothetical protein